jgi:hypothetical protein
LNQPGRYAAFFFNRIHNIWVYLTKSATSHRTIGTAFADDPINGSDPSGEFSGTEVAEHCASSAAQSAAVSEADPTSTAVGCAAGAVSDTLDQVGLKPVGDAVEDAGNVLDGQDLEHTAEDAADAVGNVVSDIF